MFESRKILVWLPLHKISKNPVIWQQRDISRWQNFIVIAKLLNFFDLANFENLQNL
ncbi:hypothetical protein MNBD_ALPHA11-863 [hydrothermal vent metagenome]|uniref:Uncharacterized protein n=1 Tax=hydrothermal vent metagenome TaxID=652676 RepID=A0A3B0TP23_9ZZZZ